MAEVLATPSSTRCAWIALAVALGVAERQAGWRRAEGGGSWRWTRRASWGCRGNLVRREAEPGGVARDARVAVAAGDGVRRARRWHVAPQLRPAERAELRACLQPREQPRGD